MTSVTAPPPPPVGQPPAGHAVLRFAASLSAALDRLAGTPTWSMTRAEQREALVELRRQRNRLKELELRVLVQADRDDIAADSGAVDTAAWLAHATGTSTASRHRDLHLATALDDRFGRTRAALAAGVIDVEKAGILTAAVQRLTSEHDDLPPGTEARAEAHLLEQAKVFDARTLRRLGHRLFEVVCPEAADAAEGARLEREEARARALAQLTIHDQGDGTSQGRFRLPTLHAQLLRKALEALTSPRRIGAARLDPQTGAKLPHATLLGLGLMELLEHHLSAVPAVNGSPFTVVVTIGLDALVSGLGVAALDTGHRVSAGEARRLACRAGIIPMVLGGDSVPLDVGRERRLFDRYQKHAINHRYQGCAADSCDRPPAWVEYHHLQPWSHGGPTDASNGISLCPAHHRMADHPQSYDLRRLPDGTVRFNRRT
ncbi:HNH endonuclease [Nocardioides panacis]|uniref:HNH endonuclease n=1 Tax=Nocardioides panacis TaxID=2849501 RepID=A0A975XZD4_9ACTN|nr:HNH endonuclease signature motif containing protein [Nocardioides panacis]QWZ07144.1 HNH endonuclease [Nocardioides panacis]